MIKSTIVALTLALFGVLAHDTHYCYSTSGADVTLYLGNWHHISQSPAGYAALTGGLSGNGNYAFTGKILPSALPTGLSCVDCPGGGSGATTTYQTVTISGLSNSVYSIEADGGGAVTAYSCNLAVNIQGIVNPEVYLFGANNYVRNPADYVSWRPVIYNDGVPGAVRACYPTTVGHPTHWSDNRVKFYTDSNGDTVQDKRHAWRLYKDANCNAIGGVPQPQATQDSLDVFNVFWGDYHMTQNNPDDLAKFTGGPGGLTAYDLPEEAQCVQYADVSWNYQNVPVSGGVAILPGCGSEMVVYSASDCGSADYRRTIMYNLNDLVSLPCP